MMDNKISNSVDRPEWNVLLKRTGSGHFFQTWQWAELCGELYGSEPRFLTLGGPEAGDEAALVIQKTRLGAFRRPGLMSAMQRALPGGLAPVVFRWRQGPVLIVSEGQRRLLAAMFDEVEELARQDGVVAVEEVTMAGYADAYSSDLADFLCQRGYEANQAATYLVDLRLPDDEMLDACHRSVRKNLRRCTREGVKVGRAVEEKGWHEFARLFIASRARQGLFVPSQRHVLLHDEMLNGRDERLMELFLAYHNGRAIGALAVLSFNGWLTEAMSANSEYALQHSLPVQDLLRWEIMRWAKTEGFHTFDLAGVAPHPKSDKEAGIRRFKAKFGGRYLEYKTYTKVFRPALYKIIKALRGWKSL